MPKVIPGKVFLAFGADHDRVCNLCHMGTWTPLREDQLPGILAGRNTPGCGAE